jgi:thiosulfate dehydrogenase [quinone] large subunit
MENPRARSVIAAAAALIGGYLLYLSANPASDFGTALPAFWVGLALFVGVAALLLRFYQPGVDAPSDDEVNVREWPVARFLRYGKDAAPFYLGLRLFLAWEWLEAGLHKVTDPAWVETGLALRSYWERAAALPAPPARPPITYPAYRSFIQFMLDNNWHTWFADLIAWGEVLIGLGFLFGGLIGFAAFFALLMNFSFLFAGSTSTNPMLVLLEVLVLGGWRVAGWWGVDRFLLPRIGTPWRPGPAPGSPPSQPGQRRAARGAG